MSCGASAEDQATQVPGLSAAHLLDKFRTLLLYQDLVEPSTIPCSRTSVWKLEKMMWADGGLYGNMRRAYCRGVTANG